MLEALKGWKTVLFNLLALLVLIATHFGYDGGNLPAGTEEAVVWLIPLVNLVLRRLTDTPVFKRSID